MPRWIGTTLTLALLAVAVPGQAQPPQGAPVSCEDQRDGALSAYGGALAEAAALRQALRARERELADTTRKLSEAEAKNKAAAAPKATDK